MLFNLELTRRLTRFSINIFDNNSFTVVLPSIRLTEISGRFCIKTSHFFPSYAESLELQYTFKLIFKEWFKFIKLASFIRKICIMLHV